jgi:beta-glucanase (GH16 family)
VESVTAKTRHTRTDTLLTIDEGSVDWTPNGMRVKMAATRNGNRVVGAGTRVSSTIYLDYGRVSARIKVSNQTGVITSFIVIPLP